MSEQEDLRLERDLRGLLDGRDPGPAPYGLRGRVDRVPEETPRHTRREAAARAISLAGAIAAGIAITVALVSVGRTRDGDVVGGPSPLAAASTIPFGPGIVTYPPIEACGYAAAVATVGLLALGVGLAVLRRRAAWIPLVAAALVPVIVVGLALLPGVAVDESNGTMVTPAAVADMPPGYTGQRAMYLIAGPSEHYDTELGFRNTGPLPVTVHGVVADGGESARFTPQWVEVRLLPRRDTVSPAPSEPFEPFTLGPGEWMGVHLVGIPGACAVGRAFDPADADGYGYEPVMITIGYDILGWPRGDRMSFPSSQLLVPYRMDCDASKAGAAPATP